jgi:hypothetical protein
MPEEFMFQDLSGATFWGVELKGATFRSVDLTGAVVSQSQLVGTTVDGFIDGLVVNGVDVTAYVNAHDTWYPLRAQVHAGDLNTMRTALGGLEQTWAHTLARASKLAPQRLRESVGGEWSFVETLRHLVFAFDKWCGAPVLGEGFDPMGIPNSGSRDIGWPGLDFDANPSLDDVLAARVRRWAKLRDYLGGATAADLERAVEVLENGTCPIRECVHTVFEEEFEHHRYAIRDLAVLEAV